MMLQKVASLHFYGIISILERKMKGERVAQLELLLHSHPEGLRRAEIASTELHTVPLDSCVADTQGAIGYQMQKALDNEFIDLGINKSVATVVTQVEVSGEDPSFGKPTKPIGSFMAKEVAMEHKTKDGWNVVEDAGRGWRRVVASPKPCSIVELETIRCLLDNEIIVIAAGGGGIPVVKDKDGHFVGKEAVIDKDLAAAMLAKDLNADLFVISTAVEKVCLNFGKPNQQSLDSITIDEAKEYISEGQFAPGSMLPKIEALVDFVSTTGNAAIVTNPANLYDSVYEGKGTRLVK